MQALVQILKLEEPRTFKAKREGGSDFTVQRAECILLNEDGSADQVGVLSIPSEQVGKITPGTYTGHYAMARSWDTKEIRPALVKLVPLPPKAMAKSPVQAS